MKEWSKSHNEWIKRSWKPLIYGNRARHRFLLLKQAILTNAIFPNVYISAFYTEKYFSCKNYLPALATVSREKMGFSSVL